MTAHIVDRSEEAAELERLANAVPGPDQLHRGQLRIAYRLAERHRDRLLHVASVGWYFWDGTRWAWDEASVVAVQAVMDTLRHALLTAVDLRDPERGKLHADVRSCESARGAEGVLRLASAMPEFAASVGDLDNDPYLLNTPTGTLDLRADALRPHEPGDRITKCTGAPYRPDAVGATWTAFLSTVLPDAEVRAFVQRLVGESLLGRVHSHVLPILTGTGRNGKSTFTNATVRTLGDYAIHADPELLIERDRAHPTGFMDLLGIRLAVMQESDDGKRLAVATVKRLTGGDPIRARKMRQDFVQFDPSHLAVMVTNHLPRVPADDPALWRRLVVVPFDVVVPIDEVDEALPERLAMEADAVLAWAVEGYRQWEQQGLNPPEAVQVATDRYRDVSDALVQFIADCCVTGEYVHVGARELWSRWVEWCRTSDEKPGTERDFGPSLEARGFSKRTTNTGKRYAGIALRSNDEEGE